MCAFGTKIPLQPRFLYNIPITFLYFRLTYIDLTAETPGELKAIAYYNGYVWVGGMAVGASKLFKIDETDLSYDTVDTGTNNIRYLIIVPPHIFILCNRYVLKNLLSDMSNVASLDLGAAAVAYAGTYDGRKLWICRENNEITLINPRSMGRYGIIILFPTDYEWSHCAVFDGESVIIGSYGSDDLLIFNPLTLSYSVHSSPPTNYHGLCFDGTYIYSSHNGIFLLLVEVNHDPTVTEPIELSWDVVFRFAQFSEILDERHCEKVWGETYTQAISKNIPYNHSNTKKRSGVLSVKFRKMAK